MSSKQCEGCERYLEPFQIKRGLCSKCWLLLKFRGKKK